MYRDGRRKNFYDGKGHMTLDIDMDSCRAVMSEARLAHFHLPNWARRLLPVARELGLTIACDLQDITNPADPYRRDFIDHADILFFSATNHSDPAPLIGRLLDARPNRIVISGMGVQGCALGTAAGIEYFPPPPLDLPVVDTNGAGDALAVGFLSSYIIDDYTLDESILRAQIAARRACSLKASSDNLIDAGLMDDLFRTLAGTYSY
jgi:sugar/nucleoside kinase (ribokinase family)